MGYADELFDLTDRVVLVTGGSRGLGREMAFAAARCGADVVIASRKYETCVETADEIEAATGRAALPYQVHVGRWDELDGLVDATYDRFGKVDVLINNAGMSPLYESLGSVTEKLFDAVVNLNLKGPFRLSALVGERMVADGGGSIINVSSSGSRRPRPEQLPYSAAKAALNALTEGLALAFGPTVRVNTLMPGPFLTDISKAWDIPATTAGARHFALQRLGNPPEIIGCRFVSGVRRVELHFRIDHPSRRWHPVATDSRLAARHGYLTFATWGGRCSRYGVTMLKFGSGLSTTARIDGSALASPITSNPDESLSPAANVNSRSLFTSLTVALAVDASAGTARYTNTPLRSVSR